MRNISLRNSIIICKFAAAKSNLCSISYSLFNDRGIFFFMSAKLRILF